MKSHRPFDRSLIERVLARFFQIKRAVGDRFWTGLEIQRHFGVSRYAATEVIEALKKRGVLSSVRGSGTRLLRMNPFELPSPLQWTKHRLTVVWPEWWTKEQRLLVEVERLVRERAQAKSWEVEFISSSLFSKKDYYQELLEGDYQVIVLIDPRPQVSVAIAQLREKRFPMMIVGGPDSVSDHLGIPVVLVEETEAARLLVLQCLSRGYRRFCVVGKAHLSQGELRHRGFEQAMGEFAHEYPCDWYIAPLSDEYTRETVLHRLRREDFPEVMIFQEYPTFQKLYEGTAEFREALKKKTVAAVYDDGLGKVEGQIVRVRFDVGLLMQNLLQGVQQLFRGKELPSRIYHPLKIEWPARMKRPT